MRAIQPSEECFSATEIAQRFEDLYGVNLHSTNVGNAAKRLGLDYLEVEIDSPDNKWAKKQRRYGKEDIPAIFSILSELAERRAEFGY
jgi:signal recognition particle subunit SEC65